MFRETVLTCSVAVIILSLSFYQVFGKTARYDRFMLLDGLSCLTSDVAIEEDSLVSAVSCMALCSGKCATIFYNLDTGSCTGCYTLYEDSSGLPSSDDSIAYRFHFECGIGERRYNTSCYTVSTKSATWSNAKTSCSSTANRFLAAPETLEELLYICTFLPYADTWGRAYIDMTDTDVEGTWKTVHGKTIDYRKPWAQTEPNGGTYENCVAILSTQYLADYNCDSVIRYVCEKNMIAM